MGGLVFIRWIRRSIQKLGVSHCDFCSQAMPPSETIWCQACLDLIKTVPRCQRCGLQTEHETDVCGECLLHPPQWDRLYCVSDYSDPLRKYINKLKYTQQFWLAQDLGVLLSKHIPEPAPLILPVPLHWKRFWWRSYNQSDHLGWTLEREFNLKSSTTHCNNKILKRVKATRPQQGLSRSFRQTNLLGAFKITKPIKEKHVALVDDVVTTGATINLLCVELRKSGVERIDVYTVCRTGRS